MLCPEVAVQWRRAPVCQSARTKEAYVNLKNTFSCLRCHIFSAHCSLHNYINYALGRTQAILRCVRENTQFFFFALRQGITRKASCHTPPMRERRVQRGRSGSGSTPNLGLNRRISRCLPYQSGVESVCGPGQISDVSTALLSQPLPVCV